MQFDELDARMRIFETAHDLRVLPGLWMVARIDGRNFTRLTKETLDFERPFDHRFRDLMIATAEHLMTCGFRVVYGYTQSDEISLLLHRGESSFGRKERKLNSILAGEASARFSTLAHALGAFDCRISQLPGDDLVVDYFRWRAEDAHRNALNAHCFWRLRGEGLGAEEAARRLAGLSVAAKNELLFERGLNFNDLPAWQKRGVGLYWETYAKTGLNPLTGETVSASRLRLKRDLELPRKDGYEALLRGLLESDSPPA
ncbi:MAG TPA: tRNA(His) guanylyltransferase Thg1 family protein [Herpetosiphonaceae bacterium]